MKKDARQGLPEELVTQEGDYYSERILDLGYDFEVYCHLKERGIDLRTDDAAVIQLVRHRCTYLLRKTLEAGGNANACNETGKNALAYALEHPRNAQGCAARLIRHGAKFTADLLHACAKNKWHELLQAVLETGIDAGVADAEGNTALHHAARKGFRRIINMLVQAGAPVDSYNKAHYTPLMLAVIRRRYGAVEALRENRADINLRCGKYQESIQDLCMRKRCSLKHDKLERLAWDETAKRDLPAYRFFCAAKANNEAKIERLIREGYDINAYDSYGYTALHFCADSGTGNVELLIRHGADLYAETKQGPEHAAALAVAFCHHNIFEKLLNCGYDINYKDSRGMTLLMHCAANEYVPGCKLLLKLGADPSITDEQGQTALFYASGYNLVCYDENIDLLLQFGADINATDYLGNTALLSIADRELDGDETHLQLIKRGIDVNIRNHAGQSALSIAKQHGHRRLIKALLEAGAQEEG